jgi:class 3 adenylate cyclase/HAMP domain-containing protein
MWNSETRREPDPRYLRNFEAHGIDLGEHRYVFIYREVNEYGEAPWTIGTYFQREDLVSQAQRLDWIPIIAAAMVLVSLVIAIILGRGLSRPSRKLAAAAAKISSFELEDTPVLELGAFRETNDAAAAFNSMVKGLKSFETYVPRSLVKELIAQHSGGEVPSEERELTVLFTDIVGFTAMAEELPASEVAAFLNEHFTLIGGCVDAEGGTIDKYIGDALMAFWGAPVWQDDTAPRACRAALAIRAAIEADNTRRGAAGLPPIRIRVGIHTGRVVVGNIGRPGRINYTVVGDTVNSSQRLESLGKEIDPAGEVTILISGATAAQLGSQFAVEPVGRFGVKGREKEIEVYSLKTSTASTEFRSKDPS